MIVSVSVQSKKKLSATRNSPRSLSTVSGGQTLCFQGVLKIDQNSELRHETAYKIQTASLNNGLQNPAGNRISKYCCLNSK